MSHSDDIAMLLALAVPRWNCHNCVIDAVKHAPMTNVDLVWFNAGGGHRAAAQALAETLLVKVPQWTVRRVNFTEVIDPSALFRRSLGFEPEDLYNMRLASGFTLGLAQELKLLQGLIRLSHRALVQRLARYWEVTRPDMVVSLIPNFNQALHDSLSLARPGVPFVTAMTDMADHPPAFWAIPDSGQHLVCGTDHAVAQALQAGCDPTQVHRVSGMILRPEFYLPPGEDRTADRRAVGLDAATPTGLVLFGGTGSRVMKRIAADLPDVPLVLMCGRNEMLAEELRAQPAIAPRIVLGHTPEVARWMQRADFFIGKPGPGSLSEAVQQGLPVIVTRNAWTMPQERWNTEWVEHHGLGVVLRSFRGVSRAVQAVCADLPAARERVRRVENRSLFEFPGLLQRIFAEAHAAGPSGEAKLIAI